MAPRRLLAGRPVLLAYGLERFVVDLPRSLSRFADGRLHLSVEVQKLLCRLGLGLTVGVTIQCRMFPTDDPAVNHSHSPILRQLFTRDTSILISFTNLKLVHVTRLHHAVN